MGANEANEIAKKAEGKARTQFSKPSINKLLEDGNLNIDVKRAAKGLLKENVIEKKGEKPQENLHQVAQQIH